LPIRVSSSRRVTKLVAIARLELGDDAVGKEIAVVRQTREKHRAAREAVLAFEIDAGLVEARRHLLQIIFGRGGRDDRARHDILLLGSRFREELGVGFPRRIGPPRCG
jgi:hypothetical protein